MSQSEIKFIPVLKKYLLLLSFLLLLSGQQLFSQQLFVLESKNLAKPDTVWVFAPTDYAENINEIYPAVYLLHGWSGNYHQWNDIMDCQAYADKYGVVIICPDGLYDSWYINSPLVAESQYADFFFDDLMPFVKDEFRIDTTAVYISGLSMGGHGALYLFTQKPERFKSAGSLSGVVDLSFCPNDYNINKYLGLTGTKGDKMVLEEFSVSGNLDKIAESGKEIIFSCGTEDPFFGINNNFKKQCDSLNIKATYFTSPGGHNYTYWKSAINRHFDFFVGR
jgi:S-formylglutathione hydrolase FrmB